MKEYFTRLNYFGSGGFDLYNLWTGHYHRRLPAHTRLRLLLRLVVDVYVYYVYDITKSINVNIPVLPTPRTETL